LKKNKNKFADSITGLCSVSVEGAKGSWDVMLTVTFNNGTKEEYTSGAVRPFPFFVPRWGKKEAQKGFEKFSDREMARRQREEVLLRMNNNEPIFVSTITGFEPIYAVRDFGWCGPTPSRMKVRARRLS